MNEVPEISGPGPALATALPPEAHFPEVVGLCTTDRRGAADEPP